MREKLRRWRVREEEEEREKEIGILLMNGIYGTTMYSDFRLKVIHFPIIFNLIFNSYL
jgi:hypothetical protein